MHSTEIYQAIKQEKIIAIVRGVNQKLILDIASSLYDGGIRLMEVTCNTVGVAEMIKSAAKAMAGKMIVGAGTVLSAELASEVVQAGAQFVVAPDTNPKVVSYCMQNDIAILPGVMTATEILSAVRLGCKMVKLFPAGALGIEYIKMIRGPINHVDMIAVGGVNTENTQEFISAGCIGVGVGSSLISKNYTDVGDWEGLTKHTRMYIDRIGSI